MSNPSPKRRRPAGRLPSKEEFDAMDGRARRQVVRNFMRRAQTTAKGALAELAALRAMLDGSYYAYCYFATYWLPREDEYGFAALLALEKEWNKLSRPPGRPKRKRARHPSPEEIAKMGPRDRHFAEWDRARRLRTQWKYMVTFSENFKREFGEDRWREALVNPDPACDIVRNTERVLRAAEAKRLGVSNN